MINGVYAFDGPGATPTISKSSIIIHRRGDKMEVNMAQLRNPHPGEILKEEFLNTIGMSQNQLAHVIGVPGNRIHAIVNGTRAITGDTDLRLCKFCGLSEGYVLRLQNAKQSVRSQHSWRGLSPTSRAAAV
jgi:antitoxin HigA-1